MKIRFLALLLAGIAGSAHAATVTYNGTEGVYANIFSSNSQQACISCHSTTRTDYDGTATPGNTADDRNYAAVGVDFNTYAAATTIPAAYAGAVTGRNSCRANARVGAGSMPPTGTALTASEQALIAAWVGDCSTVPPQTAAPAATTGSAGSLTAYSASLAATVSDNGADASYTIEWRTNAGTYGGAGSGSQVYYTTDLGASTSSARSTLWTGGGTSTESIAHATGNVLSCGATYQYRVRSSNNGAGATTGSETSFATSACTSVTTASIANQAEATTFTLGSPLATLAASGGSGSYSWSVTAGALPSGLTLDAATGKIYGTTPNLLTNTAYNFTVQATDSLGLSSATKALSITIVADNDPPAITSGTGPTTAIEGTAYPSFYDANATDPEGQTLTYSLNAAAITAGMSINASSGVISWTPPNGTTSVAVTVTASDGTVANDQTVSWTVNVTAVNTPPSIPTFSPATTGTEDTLFTYTVPVSDADDANNGIDLTWSLPSGAPAGMTISTTGTINWTPVEGQSGSFGPITVQVADGGENGALPATRTFSLAITAVNDQPVIGTIADKTVTELSTLTFTPSVTDPDDANDGVNLVWSLPATPPAGMTISNTAGTVGQISYTPAQNTVAPGAAYADVVVTVNVDDGHEDGTVTAVKTFNLRINKLDTDGDLVADYNDNCVNTANPSQADNDGDGVPGGAGGGTTGGDACDSDDDNDGISDVAEMANGLNPADPSDASGDLDGDGISNLAEFTTCALAADATCLAISTDSVGPVITTNGPLTVTATGYYTPVEATATAVDVLAGVSTPVDVFVDDAGPYRPGVHTLTWSAQDALGNLSTATQVITVVPTVSLGGTVSTAEGRGVTLDVLLNGTSPQYPVVIDYTVGGTSTGGGVDHDLGTTGSVVINSGTHGAITLNAVYDSTTEPDETAVVTLTGVSSGSAALSSQLTGTFVIVDRQLPPAVSIWAEQDTGVGPEHRNVVYLDQNLVTLEAMAVDPNGDTLTYDWSASDPALGISGTGNIVTASPSGLSDGGLYDVVVRVSDGTSTTEQRLALAAVAAAPTLAAVDTDGDGINDDVEGAVDSDSDGLLDYLDPVDAPGLVALQIDTTTEGRLRVAQVDAGLGIAAGGFATALQGGGIVVPSAGIVDTGGNPVADPDYVAVGAVYDFVISGLDDGDRVARVVLPVPIVLPPGATIRVFINGAWFTFVQTGSDAVASAPAVDGQCPEPGTADWQPGLAAGDTCIRLSLSDGGPNDADGVVNGSVHLTGDPAVSSADAAAVAPGSAKGGVAAGWFLFLLAFAGFRTRRHGK